MATKSKRTKKQSFSVLAPGATSVLLAGDFTHWEKEPISMRKNGQDVWHAELQLKPGTYHYRFVVDGQWQDDPECTLRVPNPFGGQNMVRDVQ